MQEFVLDLGGVEYGGHYDLSSMGDAKIERVTISPEAAVFLAKTVLGENAPDLLAPGKTFGDVFGSILAENKKAAERTSLERDANRLRTALEDIMEAMDGMDGTPVMWQSTFQERLRAIHNRAAAALGKTELPKAAKVSTCIPFIEDALNASRTPPDMPMGNLPNPNEPGFAECATGAPGCCRGAKPCQHEKVYRPYRVADSSRYDHPFQWICAKCGAEGIEHLPIDTREYAYLVAKFHGEAKATVPPHRRDNPPPLGREFA